jgi:formylglycine-generating enzyme required for sulfatase activity
MKKIARLVTVIFLVSALHIHAQDRGLKVVATENLGPQVNIGKQYALFIAIDAYRHWRPLKKPVADAREIRDILRQDYYIDEVIELYNQEATKANIIKTFLDLQSKLGVHDSLFIYYAGHGYLDEGSNAGFWIPVDGGTDLFSQENWLPNIQIRGYISRFKAIHVFLVSDSCFSGDILNTNRSMPPEINNAFLRRAYTLTSRQVLTSGSSEEVPDQSEVSAALKNSLRKNTSPLLVPDNIYDDVKLSVRKTLPLLGNLDQSGHQNGATFLFFRRPSAQPRPDPVVTPTPAVTTNIPANMVRVEGGTFTMGSPANEPERYSNETQRQVTVNSFYMGKYEVTQKEYQELMRTNPSSFKGDNLPVENVSWYDAVEYCNARSRNEGLTPAYTIDKSRSDSNNTSESDTVRWVVTWNRNANGYRLPTEAEWEYACRAGTRTPFSTGNNITTSLANYDGNYPYNNNAKGTYRERTTTVGSFAPNLWGLYDMHGNVYEWCWDWYGSYPSGAQTDPAGASSGSGRVNRGGSWGNTAQDVRSANRDSLTPSGRVDNLGFRLLRPQV